jgi:hypothetical protein
VSRSLLKDDNNFKSWIRTNNNMSARQVESTSSTVPSSQGQQRSSRATGYFPLHCNKCRLPLEAVTYVCSCSCVFCDSKKCIRESDIVSIVVFCSVSLTHFPSIASNLANSSYHMLACTEEHFCKDSRCPSCKRHLQEDEFFEVVVTDQTTTAQTDDRSRLEALLTKQRDDVKDISFQDICANIMRDQDSLMNTTRLFCVQLAREADQKIREGEEWRKRASAYQQQNQILKQQYQKEIQELGAKNKIQESKLKEQNNRIRDLQMELERLSMGRPTVSAGTSSRPPTNGEKAPQSLPFVRRMHNKEKEDMAKERGVRQQQRPIIGRGRETHGSFSSHSQNSSGSRGYQPYPPQNHRYSSSSRSF